MCNQSSKHQSNLISSPSTETLTLMDSPVQSPDEAQRVKFLCSFGGSIMPRPQDGKLRYVGGETRIISVPRDINYDELMARMRELFDGAVVLKYQQPDEDLDALVSVVNDDDVTNMMEEYDKLGSGDGFTRLRMFLFPHPDHDSSSPHFDSDERESERRYVDALNSLNDGNEYMRGSDSPVMESSLMNPMSMEFGRNSEIPMQQFNLRHLTIPHLGSVVQHQQQQPHTQRYSEMEAPWSPAYYSPRHHGHHDSRPVTEFPPSPSSARYRHQFGEFSEEYGRQQPMSHQHQSPFAENVMWLPAGAISNESGFPLNLGHSHSAFEGNNICEHCRMGFHRNPNSVVDASRGYPDPRWMPGAQPHLDPMNSGNEFHQFASHCADCNTGREVYGFNPEANLEHGGYPKEQNDPRFFYNEPHNHERGWGMHPHHLGHRGEEQRMHLSGAGWINDANVVDGSVVNGPVGQGNCIQQVSSNCVNHVDPRSVHTGPELGEHAVVAPPHIQMPAVEDRGMRYGNIPPVYGTDHAYQVPHGPAPSHAVWMKMQNPLRASPSYEALNKIPQSNGTLSSGLPRALREDSPSFRVGLDNPNPWVGHSQKIYGVEGSSVLEHHHSSAPKLNSNTFAQEKQTLIAPHHVQSPGDMIDFVEVVPETSSSASATAETVHTPATSVYNPGPVDVTSASGVLRLEERSMLAEVTETQFVPTVEGSVMPNECNSGINELVVSRGKESGIDSNGLRPLEDVDTMELSQTDCPDNLEQSGLSIQLSCLPELIVSMKKAALEGAEEVKAKVQENAESDVNSAQAAPEELEPEHAEADVDDESEGDHPKVFGIEQTKAEAEALAKGLQTIRNDDLEEIRELGSGTYGSVFHGKWKGSDVAIKRIKASCFAGRPSERERLIADFWKEALILSSLHHPNVVSFYGIVRDGPDGSLATVTEFMINGSLKQFLQKKDRTIDRRKRLLIAMDTAFGMEYLHGKNIVHFDLKCENLLVNMRDPHRPICKIGDLGLSKVKQHTLVSGGVRGTLPWMAPELLSGKSNMVTEKIDVYSFGIVMWELLTGEEPYAEMHCASIIGGIVNNNLRPQIPSWCDPEWKSLMESSWASEPGERPSFSEISQKLRKMAAAMNLK